MLAQADSLPLQRLYHWERERADEIFLSQPLGGGEVQDLSWSEAVAEVRRIAAFLRAQAWPPGSRIAIMSKNCAHWLLADFAIWMAGHVSVPIYPSLTADSVRQILGHSGAVACFVGKLERDDAAAMRAGIPEGVTVIALPLADPAIDTDLHWAELLRTHEPIPDSPLRAADDVATLIYTSGTTGTPKGALHAFSSLGHAAERLQIAFECRSDDRLLSYLPLAHVADRLASEVVALQSGCRVYFSESAATFGADLKRAQPTFLVSVPRLWTKFRQSLLAATPEHERAALLDPAHLTAEARSRILDRLGLAHARLAATGAAPLPQEIFQWYLALGLELLEVYGMTENFGLSHITRRGQWRDGYIGHALDGVDVRLANDGEVLVKSPGAMLGYYRDPARTDEAFDADGYLRTGDLGEIDAQGRLRLTGRAKELFKTSKGKYVAPAVIENRLGAHPAIEASCVAGAGFPQPFAIVLLSPSGIEQQADDTGRARLAAALADHLDTLNETLDGHERLDFLAVVSDAWTVDNGLVTPTLKIKRQAIESHYGPLFEAWAGQRQPLVWHSPTAAGGPNS